jgi:hypothetical protein
MIASSQLSGAGQTIQYCESRRTGTSRSFLALDPGDGQYGIEGRDRLLKDEVVHRFFADVLSISSCSLPYRHGA